MYADLVLPDADKLKIKTGLVIEIRKTMGNLGLTQQEAAKRMGITQPKVSDMMRGDFANLSERKLMDCLTCETPHHLDLAECGQNAASMNAPGFGLHALKGNLKAHWAVTVNGNWQLATDFQI